MKICTITNNEYKVLKQAHDGYYNIYYNDSHGELFIRVDYTWQDCLYIIGKLL